jgi:hypothetical protein
MNTKKSSINIVAAATLGCKELCKQNLIPYKNDC